MMGEHVSAATVPELGSEAELLQRVELLSPDSTVRGFFFNAVLEVVRQLGDESVVSQCLSACGEKSFPDFYSYPTPTFLRLLYTASRKLSPQYGGFDGALRQIGYRTVTKFLSSAAGRALQMIVKGSPGRMLDNLTLAHRTVLKGGNLSVRRLGPLCSLITIERISTPPPFVEGALQCIFEASKAKDVRVRSRPTGLRSAEFELTWE
jgi:uncharacterized protein (TIGR02265 family)